MKKRMIAAVLAGVAIGWIASASGMDPEAEPPPSEPERDRPDALRDRPVYVPPSRGAARTRIGGGTRGPDSAPELVALAPDHVGVTQRAQPTFVWFVSVATDARLDFTLTDPDAIDPLLEVTLPSPTAAGVHRVYLGDHGLTLEEGRSYDWSVALVLDPEARDRDVVAGGAVRRESARPEIEARLASGMPSHRALAEAGVWYDAIADLSDAIAARPADPELRAERAALLEQVGVAAVAAHDRGGATAPDAPN